jgi:hypothetical protein
MRRGSRLSRFWPDWVRSGRDQLAATSRSPADYPSGQVRFTGWNTTQAGDRVVRKEVRGTLKKYALPTTGKLFDKTSARGGAAFELGEQSFGRYGKRLGLGRPRWNTVDSDGTECTAADRCSAAHRLPGGWKSIRVVDAGRPGRRKFALTRWSPSRGRPRAGRHGRAAWRPMRVRRSQMSGCSIPSRKAEG